MRTRYLSLSPYNLVRVILGEPGPADTAGDNVYTRASDCLAAWIDGGILARDREPGVFPYFQEFTEPDTGERLVRKGFIALGAVEDYSARRGAPPRADALRTEERPDGAAAPHARALRTALHAVPRPGGRGGCAAR